jgi:hypothetical protein
MFDLFVPHVSIVSWLVSKGCDYTIKNQEGCTVLEEWKQRLTERSFAFYLEESGLVQWKHR